MTARPRPARAVLAVVAVLGALLLSGLSPLPAQAAPGDAGFVGPSTQGAGKFPTGEKPESKLWWNDGRWWASMFDAPSQTWHVASLDRAASRWVVTPTQIDDRPTTRADTAWLGGKLYVASHVRAASSADNLAGQPARLYRYSYAAGRYTLDAGFPVVVNDVSSETLVLDRDSAGRLWTTWTQAGEVYVNATTTPGDDTSWGTPFVLPVTGAQNLTADDISTLTEYAGAIGVMWSNQNDGAVRFAGHSASAAVATWGASTVITVPGVGQADDHLNIKSLEGDATGRVFAVIKTSLDAAGPDAPLIVVLARSAAGQWTRATFGTNADCHTRPVLVLDSAAQLVHVYATAPDSGCPYTGTAGSIFEKTSPLDSLSFVAGRGTPVLRDTSSPNLNNVTASKQTATAATGIALLASDEVQQRYWGAYEDVTAPAPSPSPTPTPSPSPSPSATPTPSPTASSTATPVPTTTDQTMVLAPAADTWVNGSSPTQNYGKDDVLDVDGSPAAPAFVRFDVRNLGGRTVRSATLRLHVAGNASAGTQAIHFVADDTWKESVVTYRTRPAMSQVLATLGPTKVGTTYSFALPTDLVQSRLGAKLSLGLDTTSPDGVLLSSRESAYPPQLVLVLG